jgi:hypothetical protein
MSGFLDQLNLRPQEKRIVVVAITVVLIVLNGLFVWPKFKEWGRLKAGLAKAKETLATYQAEINRTGGYQAQLRKLGEQGGGVAPSEQALDLQRTVQDQAAKYNVFQSGTRFVPTTGGTNQFFDEQVVTVDVTSGAGETGMGELVDFLVALGSGDSMIRVRDMMLKPDNVTTRFRLQGTLTLVASYQKKPKAAAPATVKPGLAQGVASAPASSVAPARTGVPAKTTSAPPPTAVQPAKAPAAALTNSVRPTKGKP